LSLTAMHIPTFVSLPRAWRIRKIIPWTGKQN
jgi:hypothetical protein